MRIPLALSILPALFLLSCAGRSEYLQANNILAKAETLLSLEKPHEAVEHLIPLSLKPPAPKMWCEALLLLGRAYFHMEKHAEALKFFRTTVENCDENRSASGWALYYAGRLFYEKLKKPQKGEAFLLKAIESYPDQAAAIRALQYLVSVWDNKRTLDFCKKKSKELYFTWMADNLFFEAIQIYASEGKHRHALYITEILMKHYPKSPFINDVLMLKAEIELKKGEFVQAIGTLRELLAMREGALLFVSDERAFYPRALFMIGNIFANNLALYDEAIEAFSELEKNYPKSDLKDEALFRTYEIYTARGDKKKGKETLRKLAAKCSETEKGRKAIRILQEND